MEITYKNKKIEQICTNAKVSDKAYGAQMSEKIQLRIDQIHAAESVEKMIEWNIGRCHPLTGDRKGQFAVDLVHPRRMVFEKHGDVIQIAHITEIVDYH